MDKGHLIARGRTAEVYEWRQAEVLKLFYDWCPAEWAKHEASIAVIVNQKGLASPKYIGTVNIDGRNGIIYERIGGVSMLQLTTQNPLRAKRQAKLLAELHSEINSRTGEGLPNMRPFLVDSISQNTSLSDAMKVQLISLLSELKDGNSLCHFDFHPDQVLMNKNGPVVLDWMTAVQGNRIADVARSLVILKFGQAPYMNWVKRQAANIFRSTFSRTYLNRYLDLCKEISRSDIGKWMLVLAAARLKEGIKEEKKAIHLYLKRELARNEGA
jgi:thiamine kinase-like enzyme